MPNKFVTQNRNFEYAVKNVVRNAFPAARIPAILLPPFESGGVSIPGSTANVANPEQDMFVWGIRWASRRPVGP